MGTVAVPVTRNGREPRGREVRDGPKESGKAMEEDALAPRGFVNQPLLPSHLPERTRWVPLSHLPATPTQPGPTEGKLCSCITARFILVLKKQTAFPTCLPSTAEAYGSTNNRQSTFPSVPPDLLSRARQHGGSICALGEAPGPGDAM